MFEYLTLLIILGDSATTARVLEGGGLLVTHKPGSMTISTIRSPKRKSPESNASQPEGKRRMVGSQVDTEPGAVKLLIVEDPCRVGEGRPSVRSFFLERRHRFAWRLARRLSDLGMIYEADHPNVVPALQQLFFGDNEDKVPSWEVLEQDEDVARLSLQEKVAFKLWLTTGMETLEASISEEPTQRDSDDEEEEEDCGEDGDESDDDGDDDLCPQRVIALRPTDTMQVRLVRLE